MNAIVIATRLLPVLFSASAGLSAFLLFWSQPLMGKALLPLLGGAPSVWNTAMMFFQIVLLAGYIYAHAIARLARRVQAAVHFCVLVAALLMLPFGDTAGLTPAAGAPLIWLLGTLVATVGLPFFAISASAPLLQSWFGHTAHRDAGDPYFLYSASNLGSLAALLGFPFVLEPAFSVDAQGRLWAAGFMLLAVLLGVCLSQARGGAVVTRVALPAGVAAPRWAERAIWVFLGFVPSSLLLGVTGYVATDLAAVPLLWVVPLALYLLSFVIAFGRVNVPLAILPSLLAGAVCLVAGPLLFARLAGGAVLPVSRILVAMHFGAFFVVALACHVTVAARRPDKSRLTEFYVFLSTGGALGGIFNALLAPLLFHWTYEYEIALVLACLVRFLLPGAAPLRARQLLLPAVLLGVTLAVGLLAKDAGIIAAQSAAAAWAFVVMLALLLAARRYPLSFGPGLAAVLVAATIAGGTATLRTERSFFGVHRVVALGGGQYTALMHGSTVHGVEARDPARWRDILGYYAPAGPAGAIMAALPAGAKVGVIGLGTGALACYAKPGQDWRFFEIDPVVAAIARDRRYFHFLSECGGAARIDFGDGRLQLAALPEARFDLLVVDAFSSDSIPLHLLTREAMVMYAAHLTSGGMVAFHISNRYLNLRPAIAATAAAAGLVGYGDVFTPTAAQAAGYIVTSEWLILAPNAPSLARFAQLPQWQPLSAAAAMRPWTDKYSNILAVLR